MKPRSAAPVMVFFLVAASLMAGALSACQRQSDQRNKSDDRRHVENARFQPGKAGLSTNDASLTTTSDLRQRIEKNCGRCHAYPQPETMTWRTWQPGIRYMFQLFKTHYPNANEGLTEKQVMDFYRARAARTLPPPTVYPELDAASDMSFKWRPIAVRQGPALTADVVFETSQMAFIIANMIAGDIQSIRSHQVAGSTGSITRLKHPSRVVRRDVDGDGHVDLLMADLGIFAARDTQKSRLILRRGGVDKPKDIVMMTARSRIADMLVHDFNDDGYPDIAVAEFGWQKTGGVYLLIRAGVDGSGEPKFKSKTLSQRPGAVSLGLGDLLGTGTSQLVVGYAQHDEKIIIYDQPQSASPTTHVVFQAHTPLWGLLALIVVDADDDGDLDIVHVNGDALDAPKLAPFQGVHLVQNEGKGHFKTRTLAHLPGAHGVAAGDFDADGRTDFLAVSNLPPGIERTLGSDDRNGPPRRPPIESIVLLRQAKRGQFVPFSLRRNDSCFSRVIAGDWDGDGDVDAAFATFGLGWQLLGETAVKPELDTWPSCTAGPLVILENQRKSSVAQPLNPSPVWRRPPGIEDRMRALEAITLNDPKDVANRVNLGGLFTRVGRVQDAIDVLEQARQVNPQEKGVYLNLSIAHDVQRRFPEAERYARQALTLDPNYTDAMQQHAITLARLGRTDDAVSTLQAAIKKAPATLGYRLNLGTILAANGRFKAAIDVFEGLLAIEPGHGQARQYLRRARHAMDQAMPDRQP
ncbi:MAG: tetratricopeptide repeat protein [Myxococcota bacterium]|nr:tetratricopeptide repeat protein [Myxococcota bacterium]